MASKVANNLLSAVSDVELRAWVSDAVARHGALGGCDACRHADQLSDRICTLPDISREDLDCGISGVNCSRWDARS